MTISSHQIAVVGAGRVGTLLAAELGAGAPRLRGDDCADADVVLLCVPDDQIRRAAAVIAPSDHRLVGHCAASTTLEPLTSLGHEAFSMHPLMSITESGAQLAGARSAVAGSTPRARLFAAELARTLGMEPFEVDDEDRAAYHAAASIASNFLVTLEAFAERLGTDRDALAPLVRATVENWATQGPHHALTGPVARGDEQTIARQRDAVARRAPDLLELFDALTRATRDLAAERHRVTA